MNEFIELFSDDVVVSMSLVASMMNLDFLVGLCKLFVFVVVVDRTKMMDVEQVLSMMMHVSVNEKNVTVDHKLMLELRKMMKLQYFEKIFMKTPHSDMKYQLHLLEGAEYDELGAPYEDDGTAEK